MELKRVMDNEEKGYAKKNEINKKELKKFVPAKWIIASSTGIVTLLYSSPKNSIHKIGVVFGCSYIITEEEGNSITYRYIIPALSYLSCILFIAFIISLLYYFVNRKKLDKEKRKKTERFTCSMVILSAISFIIARIL